MKKHIPKGSIIFGKMLNNLIIRNNDTIENLSEYIGYSVGYMCSVIGGRIRINPNVFQRIMEKYKVSETEQTELEKFAVFTIYCHPSWSEKGKKQQTIETVEIKMSVAEGQTSPEQVIIKMMKDHMPTLSETGKKQIKRLLKAYE